jgi:hypothetical protein
MSHMLTLVNILLATILFMLALVIAARVSVFNHSVVPIEVHEAAPAFAYYRNVVSIKRHAPAPAHLTAPVARHQLTNEPQRSERR